MTVPVPNDLSTYTDQQLWDERNTVIQEMRVVRNGHADATEGEVDALIAKKRELDALIKTRQDAQRVELPTQRSRTYDSVARVTGEAEVYNRGAERGVDGREPTSWVVDAYRAQVKGDLGARGRLEAHARRVESDPAYASQAQRAGTTGAFAGLVPPQYLTELAALAGRNGRPVANSVNRQPLPETGMSLIIPRGTTGASVAPQATENAAVSNTDEAWTNLTVPVVTAAGQQNISRQLLERGAAGTDTLIFTDLLGAYYSEVDRQILVGTGTGNTALGILQTSGFTQATAFTAAATTTTFYSKVAGAVSAVASAGTIIGPADRIFMHPRRWAWLQAQVDGSGRPLVVPNSQSGFNAMGALVKPGDSLADDIGPAAMNVLGNLQGLPLTTSANIPTNIGTGPEDQVIVANSQHLLLFEDGDGTPTELRFDQTPMTSSGTQLSVTLALYGYFAFTSARYPTAVAVVGGNAASGFGLVAPSF